MKTKTAPPKTVSEYVAAFPPGARNVLKTVRTTIRKALPDAEEAISYGMPTFRRHGSSIIYFAGWKEHFSLYPSTARLAAAFKEQLAPYEVSGKGTIRFPLSEPVPVKLIAALAKFRAKEAAERSKAKAGSAKVSRRG